MQDLNIGLICIAASAVLLVIIALIIFSAGKCLRFKQY